MARYVRQRGGVKGEKARGGRLAMRITVPCGTESLKGGKNKDGTARGISARGEDGKS